MQVLSRGGMLRSVLELPVRDEIARMRYVEEAEIEKLDILEATIKSELGKLNAAGGEADDNVA